MKRKDYQRPTINIVKLQHRSHLLAGSPSGRAGVQDYTMHDYEED